MAGRSRYVRRVRAVDHELWRRRKFDDWIMREMSAEYARLIRPMIDDLLYGAGTGEPLGFSGMAR